MIARCTPCTQKSKGSGQETWYNGYDHLNHLTSVRKTSDGTTNVVVLTYTYDAEGKRVKEQASGGTSPAETRFAYDSENIWADLDSSNSVTVRRTFGELPDQLLTRTVTSGANAGLWFYQTDVQGSVRDLVNASSQVLAHLDYDGYGGRTDPQSSVSDRYGYTGREWQIDVGIQHNRRRDFIPALGRWMQEDPITFAAGDFNLTRYVGNDPLNRLDPSGLYVVSPVGVLAGILALLVIFDILATVALVGAPDTFFNALDDAALPGPGEPLWNPQVWNDQPIQNQQQNRKPVEIVLGIGIRTNSHPFAVWMRRQRGNNATVEAYPFPSLTTGADNQVTGTKP